MSSPAIRRRCSQAPVRSIRKGPTSTHIDEARTDRALSRRLWTRAFTKVFLVFGYTASFLFVVLVVVLLLRLAPAETLRALGAAEALARMGVIAVELDAPMLAPPAEAVGADDVLTATFEDLPD